MKNASLVTGDGKPVRIQWNRDFETYEAIYADGYILPLRDDWEAKKLAAKHQMEIAKQCEPPRHYYDTEGGRIVSDTCRCGQRRLHKMI